jgi:cytochrome c-type biogenesis protein CcsB
MLSLMDPSGQVQRAQEQLQRIRAAYLARSPAAFNQASAEFLATVRSLGPKLGAYPRQKVIDLEVAYNRWAPFRFAWIFTMTAALAMLLAMGTRWKWFYLGALGLFVAGMAAMFIGFGMRVAISGRAPVTNMYESVIYVGLGTAFFGLVFELIYRKRYILTAAACVSTLALIMADNCPAHLDPTIHPLQPVLRSNYWLILHVMTITLSYAAFALALGIANITLGYFLFRSRNRETIAALSRFTYKVLQVGVLLLAAGTILGGVWADYSWGRFWGWDPKEVWALIALLGYLAVLHARHVNWVGPFGLAACAVACFSLVVVAWYGVNFVMGAGLHSYGFGGGGEGYVGGVLAAQLLYVALAALRSHGMPTDPALDPSTPRSDLACTSG